jgi:alpha-beta hydrolase superfamily lysophospholipase
MSDSSFSFKDLREARHFEPASLEFIASCDAPSSKQVWEDITTFVQEIRTEFPQISLFLGGHSTGSGLVLNYISQPVRKSVSGYIFLSPQLGSRALTDRFPELSRIFAVL